MLAQGRNWAGLAVVVALAWPSAAQAAPGDITTVAGNGSAALSGDEGPATSASINHPQGVIADTIHGGYYIADNFNHVVRRVDPLGKIHRVAGDGTQGFGGDGGPAIGAQLNYPRGLALDAAGNLYIADTNNSRIRKVTPGGTITTVAGNGGPDTPGLGDGGPATDAQLCFAGDVAVEPDDDLLLADTCHQRIRRVDAATQNITTVAGNGTAGAGGDFGPATSAQLNFPQGVAVVPAPFGGFAIADTDNNKIRYVGPAGDIRTIIGTGTAGDSGDGGPGNLAQLRRPQGLEVTSDASILIADSGNHRVRKSPNGQPISTVAGTGTSWFSGDGGPATAAQLAEPYAVTETPAGDLLIAENANHRIRRVEGSFAQTFVVSNPLDTTDSGGCQPFPGGCTLREAIDAANATPARDRITFSIGLTGVQTITTTGLPVITQPVEIDGTTQPGYAGQPLIEITRPTVGGDGLNVRAPATIRGLAVNHFGSAIVLDPGSDGSTIEACYVGTTPNGLLASGNGYGVEIRSSGNTVGGETAAERNVIAASANFNVLLRDPGGTDPEADANVVMGNFIGTDANGTADLDASLAGVRVETQDNTIGGSTPAARNVISGSGGTGISVADTSTTDVADRNVVRFNHIGTDVNGTADLGNGGAGIGANSRENLIADNLVSGNGSDGIALTDTSGDPQDNAVERNRVGTDANGAVAIPNGGRGITVSGRRNTIGPGNVASGNGQQGIQIVTATGDENRVVGNFVGTNAAGTGAVPNLAAGVLVDGGSDNTIGGTAASDRNVVSGNGNAASFSAQGVRIEGSGAGSSNSVIGNYVGLTSNGFSPLGNKHDGIFVRSPSTTVAGNVVSDNGEDGIQLIGPNADGNTVTGNRVGTDSAGSGDRGNANEGIEVLGSSDNVIGSAVPADRNVVAGNGGQGVFVDDSGPSAPATNNRLLGNYIGLKANGDTPLENAFNGILVRDGGNAIGGTGAGEGNVVSGNGQSGVRLEAGQNTVYGNRIGTERQGEVAAANQAAGVVVTGAGNSIGDDPVGAGNVISGNRNEGVFIDGAGANHNEVKGNLIGTDDDAAQKIANGTRGIYVNGPDNLIGGTVNAGRNVISGNDDGIFIETAADRTTVRGNYIGTNSVGTGRLGNEEYGIRLSGPDDVRIGGSGAGEFNIIGDNNRGILVEDSTTERATIQGNLIGVGLGGAALGNRVLGVAFTGPNSAASAHLLGGTGPGEGNTIANNAGPGVQLTGTASPSTVSIRRNAIHSNSALGIDLGGIGANDSLDADTGPNGGQNHPDLGLATTGGGTLTVRGQLQSKPDSTYAIDFFSNTACDASGAGEGETWLGSASVTTNASGLAEIDEDIAGSVPEGRLITATATDADGNTSEFSGCREATGPPAASVGDATVAEGGGTASVPVTLSSPSAQTVKVDVVTSGATASAGSDYTAAAGTVTFVPGDTSEAVPVPITDDTMDEPDETFSVVASNPQAATIADGSGLVTITDDDAAPSLSIGDVSQSEGSGGSTDFTFTASLSAPSGKQVTVDASTADGTAAAPGDYTALSAPVTFAPGDTSETVTVHVAGDALDEPDETFSVNLQNPVDATLADGQGSGTITDDDDPPAVSAGDAGVGEGDGDVTVPVTLNAPSARTVTVDWATAAGSASAADFSARNGTLAFAPGETTKNVTVPVADDSIDEADEQFTVGVSNPSEATIGDGSGAVTIADDDGEPQLSVADVSTPEGSGGIKDAKFAVTLSAPSAKTVTVDATTSDGTASAPGDYSAGTVALTFAPGETSKDVSVPLVTDEADEADETFGLALSGESNAGVARRAALGTILNDDDRPGISVDDVRVGEDTGRGVDAVFTVSLSKVSRRATSVRFATSDGSAAAGSDYGAVDSTITFAPGERTKQVAVPVSGDALDEPDEAFAVRMTDAVNGVVDDGEGTGTIVDDDATPLPPPQQPEQRDTDDPGLTLNGLVRRIDRADLLSDGLGFGLTPDEAVSLDVTLVARPRMLREARSGDVVIARKKYALSSSKRTVRLKVLRKLRRKFTHRRADLRLIVLATDAAGNRARVTKPVSVRP